MKGVVNVIVEEVDMIELVQVALNRHQIGPYPKVTGVRWDPKGATHAGIVRGAFVIVLEPGGGAPPPRHLGTEFHSSGGKARAKKLTAERRSEIARHAANVRWARYRRLKGGGGMAVPRGQLPLEGV